ncbi:MAG: hypothetical protein IT427_12950 [Pirellulales bacterium]|jgi:predicted enzyme related to lactoylglutathione lyase|nr:hypothetical protein [Pirellulales bacterium]
MGKFNSQKNRAVWFDIPGADLARVIEFYQAFVGVGVERQVGGTPCGVIEPRRREQRMSTG